MNKKVFTLLLLAVFVLAQFSIASAAPAPVKVAGDVTITALPTFHTIGNVDLKYKVVNMNPGTKYIVAWARLAHSPANLWANCTDVNNTTNATDSGTYNFASFWADQNVVEFYITVDDQNCAGGAVAPDTASAAMVSTFIDDWFLTWFMANPPSLSTSGFALKTVSCNTFEMWGLASDIYGLSTGNGYSGFDSWNENTIGAYAAPAPIGTAESELSWVQTIPSSANGPWSFSIKPSDVAGNAGGLSYFRGAVAIAGPEKEACKDFSDVAGHEDEVYVRYLADLGLISGNPDGSYGVDSTLTRAEAAALFEKANGYDAATLPTAAPSADCTFTDVADTDWFAGWVWQACADGFMNGVGGGLFDPSNLLTRGQIVTIFNNISIAGSGTPGSYLDNGATLDTILNLQWGVAIVRTAAWTDVSLGAYYAIPVTRAYGVGVADGTSATTFSPDQAILRGEFAKMLYRALSRIP